MEQPKKTPAEIKTSVIRTVTPMLVGFVVTLLASFNIEGDAEFKANLFATMQLIVSGLYYVIVRWIESKYPKFGILLGVAKAPEYTEDQ